MEKQPQPFKVLNLIPILLFSIRKKEKNNCKIQLGALDFPNKRIVLGDVFEPTGDNQADIAAIIEYYGQFKGKHPDQF